MEERHLAMLEGIEAKIEMVPEMTGMWGQEGSTGACLGLCLSLLAAFLHPPCSLTTVLLLSLHGAFFAHLLSYSSEIRWQ